MDCVIKTPKYLNPNLKHWKGIDDIDIVKAAWLMGKHSRFWMFNLYPENVPKEFRIDIIYGILDSGLRR